MIIILMFELMKTLVSFMIKNFNETYIDEIKNRFLKSLDAVFNSVSYIKSIEATSTKVIEKSGVDECKYIDGKPTCGKRLFIVLKINFFNFFKLKVVDFLKRVMYFQFIHEKFADGEESKMRQNETLLESIKKGCLFVMNQMNRLEIENSVRKRSVRTGRSADDSNTSTQPDYCTIDKSTPKIFERLEPLLPEKKDFGHILTAFVAVLSFSVICVILYRNKEDLFVTHKYFWTNGTNLLVRTSIIRGVAIGMG